MRGTYCLSHQLGEMFRKGFCGYLLTIFSRTNVMHMTTPVSRRVNTLCL